MKILCPIHHFFYSDVECPICLKERTQKLSDKYLSTNKKHTNGKSDISENMLLKLKEKFNKK